MRKNLKKWTNNENHCKLNHSHIDMSVIFTLDDTHCLIFLIQE